MKIFKKLTAVLVAFLMCVSMLPMTAFAAATDGVCSECNRELGADGSGHAATCSQNSDTQEGSGKPTRCDECNRELGADGSGHAATCSQNPNIQGGETEKHVHSYTYLPNTDGATHTGTCSGCAGGTEGHYVTDGHADADGNGACDACGYIMHVHAFTMPAGTDDRNRAATCTEAGAEVYRCSCGELTVKTIPATGHSWDGVLVESGTGHAQHCTACGAFDKVEAHNFTEIKTSEVKPTCTTPGSKAYRCSCGAVKTETVPATGHKDDNNDGTCDVCSADLTCAHVWDEDKTVTVGATCTAWGYTEKTCAKCGTVQRIINTNMLGHNYVETVTEKATCTEHGVNTVTCTRCGDSYTKETRAGHDFDNGIFVNGGDGTHVKKCANCDATAATYAEAHTPAGAVRENVVAATAARAGSYDEVVYCSVCGAELSRVSRIIPATGTGAGIPTVDIGDNDVPLGGEPDNGEVEIDDGDVPLAGLMTRAEFVNYLYAHEGSPSARLSTFLDVPDDYVYAMAIGWAQANYVTIGVAEDEFAPEDLVTVGQARLFLERFAWRKGIEMPELAALMDKDLNDILDNADELLAEFFGEELPNHKEETA